MCVSITGVLIVLSSMTKQLEFIPQAALSAVIFVAIANLIHFKFFWEVWKYSKKDFFTALVTLTFTFVFDTSIGLAIGLGCSVLMYLVFDIIFSKSHEPRLFVASKDGGEIDVVRIESDLNFLNAFRIKDFITSLVLMRPVEPEVTNRSEFIRFKISQAFDRFLKPNLLAGVDKLPKAVVIDLCIVKTVDITGLTSLQEALDECRKHKVLVALINVSPDVRRHFNRFGIRSDKSTEEVDFEEYEKAYELDLWAIQSQPVIRKRPRKASHEYVNDLEAADQLNTDGKGFSEIEMQTVADVSSHGAHNSKQL
jgi:MFS superfamily sulfate permease-like transporter